MTSGRFVGGNYLEERHKVVFFGGGGVGAGKKALIL